MTDKKRSHRAVIATIEEPPPQGATLLTEQRLAMVRDAAARVKALESEIDELRTRTKELRKELASAVSRLLLLASGADVQRELPLQ
jgi:hypothetical protein